MKTDRELLEFAAKAAGVGPLDFDYAKREAHGMYVGPRLPMPQGVLMAAMWTYWNPLEKKSDALELIVKLHIDLEWQEDGSIEAYQKCDGPHFCASEQATMGYDIGAATRRAIVRVAANIGEKIP